MKVCSNCGTQYDDSVKFCAKCGTKLPDEAEMILNVDDPVPAENEEKAPAAPKTIAGMPIAKFAALAAAALAVILLLVIFIPKLFAGGGSGTALKDFVYLYPNAEDEWIGFSKSGKIVKQKSEDRITDGSWAADGTLFVFVTNEDEMWTFNGSSFKKVAENVDSFKVSQSGKGIAYVDEDDTLYLYNGSKSQKVAEEIESFKCISPDGKAVAFTKKDDDVSKAYLYNGKVQELGKGITPMYLSEDGKLIYLRRSTDSGNAYYVQKGTDSDSRQKLGDKFSNVIFNNSGTQVVYFDGSKAYFSENGGERQSIGSNKMQLLTSGELAPGAVFSAVANLKNQFYAVSGDQGYTISKLTSKLELESRIKNVNEKELLPDGKTLIYSKNGNLYSADISKSSPESTKLVDSYYRYYVSLDGKMILYLDEDKVTYTMKLGGKPQKVSEDSADETTPCGSGFLYLLDDELYFTTGGKGSKVSGLSDDVQDLGNAYVYTIIECDDDSVYLTTNGKSLKKIYAGN